LTTVKTTSRLSLAAAFTSAVLFTALSISTPAPALAEDAKTETKPKANEKTSDKTDSKDEKKEKKMTKTDSGLQYRDTKEGDGPTPETGQVCVVHYTGWLWENGEKGKKFDSSVDRDDPLEFPVGKRRVIAGWDEGVASMKVGSKRELLIPPDLGYGPRGFPGAIPPNSTLFFEVELLKVK
jgi:peptidylprolyl isomerase